MKREIEFRGKVKRPDGVFVSCTDKNDGEWVFGDLEIRRKDGMVLVHLYNADGGYYRKYYVDPDTIGEFTGLTDKNDKEIYEGDIVECVSWNEYFTNPDTGEVMQPFRRKMIVEFRKGGFKMVEPMPEPMKDNEWDIICNGDIVTIGNIYDNPELLSTK